MRSRSAAFLLVVGLCACGPGPNNAPSDFAVAASGDLATARDLATASDLAAPLDLTFVCASDSDCKDPTPRCDHASGACVACLPANDNCTNGSFCARVNGVYLCSRGCKIDADCPGGDGGAGKPACCNHLCTDLYSDSANCGACGGSCGPKTCCTGQCADLASDGNNCGVCGKACTGGQANWSCTNSKCAIASCNGTWSDCNMNPVDGCEVNIATDAKNCLGCGNACKVQNGSARCLNGCQIDTCAMGFMNCDNQVQSGCNVSVGSDLNNCGGCNKVCPVPSHGTPSCKGGLCGVGSCAMGFGDCDQQAANGCEVDLTMDTSNCGSCGSKCAALANAQVGCANGQCGIAACMANFKDCDGNPMNGCEANLLGDLKNCGACGNVCAPVANAVSACSNACVIQSCSAGYADCDMKYANGCEVSVAMDLNNCGSCGHFCAPPPNASAGCAGGACGIGTCSMGFGDCDGNAQNGCEANLLSDGKNCGACGTACGMMEFCTQGKCLAQGCSNTAKFSFQVVAGVWACATDHVIGTYAESNALCQTGFTPATYKLVQGLPFPTLAQHKVYSAWYQGVNPNNGGYIRTGQKRRGGCVADAHGDIYIADADNGWTSNTGGWHDLYYGGSSCTLPTDAANNMSHQLAGVICVFGTYEPPAP